MNSILKASGSLGQLRNIFIWNFTRLLFGIAMAVLLLNPAFAQYSSGSSGSGGGYGSSGKSIGIAVGAAAGAGVGLLYLRHAGSRPITGCVSQTNHALTLHDEKRQRTYFLLPGNTGLKPGELIEVTGKKLNYGPEAQYFQVKRVVKNLGDCDGSSKSNSQ